MKRIIAIALIAILLPVPVLAAKYQAEYVVGWKGSGTHEDPYTPNWGAFTVDKYEDTTGQPGENIVPDPNLFVAKVEADNSTLDAMVGAGFVEFWREKIVEPLGPGASLDKSWLNKIGDFLLPEAWAQTSTTAAVTNKDEKPKKNAMKNMKDALKAKGVKDNDLNKTEFKDVNKDSTKTRKELADEFRTVAKDFPKKVK